MRFLAHPVGQAPKNSLEESFGWLKSSAPIDHPSAKQREGKIYASKKAG